MAIESKAGLLKLWVATHKWVPEPSDVACGNIIMVMISLSLVTNKTGHGSYD